LSWERFDRVAGSLSKDGKRRAQAVEALKRYGIVPRFADAVAPRQINWGLPHGTAERQETEGTAGRECPAV
jgi:hypothetical protein